MGTDNDGAFHWGAGIKYCPTHWMNIRLDFRHIVSARAFDQDDANQLETLAGISVVMGGRPTW